MGIVLPAEYAHVNKGVSFQIKASASCSDGINKVEYKMTRKATGDYIEDSGWTAMAPSGGYYVATFTPYSTWSAPGDYWIIVRALSNRGTSSQRMYGHHWHTVYLDP